MMKFSIIMPNYNGAKYIKESVQSVIFQTYNNWELIIVDDCSTDTSVEEIKEFRDNRILFVENNVNKGAAVSRNIGIELATGDIIAFLDSDDLWKKNKLQDQLMIYKQQNTAIVFSNYEAINSNGEFIKKITAPTILKYKDLLKSNHIGCLTGSYNVNLLGKHYFIEHGHEDYILWLSILKKGHKAVNTNTCLACRRLLANSLSSNKKKAINWQWKIYRNIENLNFFQSSYYFLFYIYFALKKHR